jgi:hypothetical protein
VGISVSQVDRRFDDGVPHPDAPGPTRKRAPGGGKVRDVRIVIAAAVVALCLVPAAGAAFGPPLTGVPSTLHSLPVLVVRAPVALGRQPSSCSAHALKSPRGSVGRIERKLAPVACEQPPRSNLMGTGFFIVLAP